MHATPPEDRSSFPPPGGGAPAFAGAGAGAGPQVDAIVATATAPPPPVSRAARRRAERMSTRAHATRVSNAGGGSPAMRLLTWGLLAILGLGGIALMTGLVPIGGPPGTDGRDKGRDMDGSWSYYHDRDYETEGLSAKWDSDRSRSTDPDEAVLGDTSRWEYDGPYRYGPYGSDGMRRRTTGRESRDPLYSQPAPIQDVFSAYGGDLDPSGGQPVGVAPSSMTNPYYDPYAGYSNPYANRIRLGYGEGVGRGMHYDPLE